MNITKATIFMVGFLVDCHATSITDESPPTKTVLNQSQELCALQACADSGDAKAQSDLASAYRVGKLGLKVDPAEALRLLKLSAENGYLPAQHSLASAYEYGNGVPRDGLEALRYYKLAADQGDVYCKESYEALYTIIHYGWLIFGS